MLDHNCAPRFLGIYCCFIHDVSPNSSITAVWSVAEAFNYDAQLIPLALVLNMRDSEKQRWHIRLKSLSPEESPRMGASDNGETAP